MPRFHPCRFVLAAVLCTAMLRCVAAPIAEPITHAAEVLGLTAEQAGSRLRIAVTGVVTAAEPDWGGKFFLQDDTGGVFVENIARPAPSVGEVIALEGVSHPGAFAPIISTPAWRTVGTAELPPARIVAPEDLMSGAEDSQRVEVVGVVRTARADSMRVQMDLAVAGYRLQVSARPMPEVPLASLIGARVQVHGTAASHYMMSLRHLTSVAVYAPRREDFAVLQKEAVDPFVEPPTPIRSVAQYRRGRRPEERVHVRGMVTLQRPGTDLFVQDDTGGIHVETSAAPPFRVGDRVDAVGFLEQQSLLPVIRDAVLVRAPGPAAPVAARVVPFAEIARGEHHGDMIRLRGRVLERSTRPYVRTDGVTAGVITSWLVQSPDITFNVDYTGLDEPAELAATPVDSTIEADGVCFTTIEITEAGTATKLTSLRLLLPTPASLRMIARPSWFTPQRLLIAVAVFAVLLLIVVAWSLTIARKNTALHEVVDELKEARDDLQVAHDTLEQKVEERSAQLQVEMTARKAAELQFKGVLAERTRLARDLHDTLEQTLSGIALRLKAAAKVAQDNPVASGEHLQTARNWLHQSQVDLRRSIWDLRSRELEQFDLARALRYSAEQLIEGSDITLKFETRGGAHRLSEIVEENLLRLAQEALTNIAKHARATQVAIELEFAPDATRLRIADNGVGFDEAAAPRDGHFGLIGMRERGKRIGAKLAIHSAVGRGTTIAVAVPRPSANADAAAPGDAPLPPPT